VRPGGCRSVEPGVCGDAGEQSPARPPPESRDWLATKLSAGREILFPTYVYRTNIMDEVGAGFFDKLSRISSAKYSEFRRKHLQKLQKQGGSSEDVMETIINDAFFQFQETHEHSFRHQDVRDKWPELYGSEEFQQLLQLARRASIAYLRQSGAKVSKKEVESGWLIMWTAVYPQDPLSQGRHGWHTHQESVVSGVFYAHPQQTPLLFADPRGAPPIEDYEQYRASDLLFEPKAPFDAHYQFFAGQGELVLFPSWLVHKVPPPMLDSKDGFRVVFPFNFHLGSGGRPGNIWDGWERTVPVVATAAA